MWGWCFGDVTDDRTIAGVTPSSPRAVDRKQQAGAFYNRGVAHRNKGQLELALQDYGQAIRLDPTDADIFYNRGVVLQSLGQTRCRDRGYDGDQAGRLRHGVNNRAPPPKTSDRALRTMTGSHRSRTPVLQQPLCARAIWAVRRRWRTATSRCGFAHVADALASRGLAWLKLAQLDAAIRDYDAALRAKPQMAEALFGRGVARRKKGDITGGDGDIAAAKAAQATCRTLAHGVTGTALLHPFASARTSRLATILPVA